MACNWICPVTRYLVMSPYHEIPRDEPLQVSIAVWRSSVRSRWHLQAGSGNGTGVSIVWSSVLVDLVNGRWGWCWRMSGGCFCQNRPWAQGVAAEISAGPQRVKGHSLIKRQRNVKRHVYTSYLVLGIISLKQFLIKSLFQNNAWRIEKKLSYMQGEYCNACIRMHIFLTMSTTISGNSTLNYQ
jgi:hypothetical protein